MNPATAVLLALAGAAAAVNWVGVARGDRRLVYAAKPSTLALLVGAAAVLDAGASGLDGTPGTDGLRRCRCRVDGR